MTIPQRTMRPSIASVSEQLDSGLQLADIPPPQSATLGVHLVAHKLLHISRTALDRRQDVFFISRSQTSSTYSLAQRNAEIGQLLLTTYRRFRLIRLTKSTNLDDNEQPLYSTDPFKPLHKPCVRARKQNIWLSCRVHLTALFNEKNTALQIGFQEKKLTVSQPMYKYATSLLTNINRGLA